MASKDPFALIIFGITGNLTQKYLIQALYDMAEADLLPEEISIIGIARRKMSQEEFASYLDEVLHKENIHHKHEYKKEVVEKLLSKFHYLDGSLDDPGFYPKLKGFLEKLTADGRPCDNRIYYLATYPELYPHVFEGLQRENLNKQDRGWVRLMIEKPIGHDLKSAKELNTLLAKYFTEDQIYRIDHYLGKETLQNILTFRFGNSIFEPLMNPEFVDHIQITASEDFGIGERGGYYDKVGSLKDVGQNHQLQMLAFATMDEPSEFSNRAVTDQRIKVLRGLSPKGVVFGQYEGYRREKNVDPQSRTDTFYAFKAEITGGKLKGVPVYVRGGKKLKQTVTEISIVFKVPKERIFKDKNSGMEPNILVYRIQPNEGIVVRILVKKPGHQTELQPEYMQYCYKFTSNQLPDPYEKLISDTINGDQTFFNDAEEVEAQWAFIDPLSAKGGEPIIYKEGTWGPKEADSLIREDGREWLEPSMLFCRF